MELGVEDCNPQSHPIFLIIMLNHALLIFSNSDVCNYLYFVFFLIFLYNSFFGLSINSIKEYLF